MVLSVLYHIGFEVAVPDSGLYGTGSGGLDSWDMRGCTKCEIVEQNLQFNHAYMILLACPKIAICDLLPRLKVQTAKRIFRRFREMKKKSCCCNNVWSKG